MLCLTKVPKHFHFVFGLKPQSEPFHLVHFLCLESCRQVNRPDAIFFHYRHMPYGDWWERIKPHLVLCPVRGQADGFDQAKYTLSEEGRLVERMGLSYAHESDFIRLSALSEHGGIYADMDTLFVQPYPTGFYDTDCLLGLESPTLNPLGVRELSLCNAVIMAVKGAGFVRTWLDLAAEVFDGSWSRHSCQLATALWKNRAADIKVVHQDYFYHFESTTTGIESIFLDRQLRLRNVYSIHLWAHLWWAQDRVDFTEFHAGLVDEQYLRHAGSTYAHLASPFASEYL